MDYDEYLNNLIYCPVCDTLNSSDILNEEDIPHRCSQCGADLEHD
jgi:translation initiation factor 2 beta subunit (eIF-2beta)/eIF-5